MQPMQLNLLLADLPSDEGSLWEQLDQTARDAVNRPGFSGDSNV